MKRLIVILISLISTCQVYASHVAGGNIWYEYIGDSTGIPFQYKIHLELLRKNDASSSVSLGPTTQITMTSSCSSQQNITLYRVTPSYPNIAAGDGGYIPPVGSYCRTLSSSDQNNFNISIHHYEEVITLGACADILFSYTLCCLNTNIVNVQNPASQSFYIECSLNTTVGPNNSPEIMIAPLYYYCLNKPVVDYYSAIDSDGDSLYYSLQPILGANSSLMPYAAGYSYNQPISSTSGIKFNNQTGVLSFTPSQIEVALVKVQVQDYRLIDTANRIYALAGTIGRQVQYIISSTCDSSSFSMTFEQDSTGTQNDIQVMCSDSSITFHTELPYMLSTLASDGSDFAIISKSSGTIIPIVKATPHIGNMNGLLSNEITLHLYKPLFYDDSYSIVSKIGSDTNTISTICGVYFPANDTLTFEVTDCNTQFSLTENAISDIQIYPSPANDILFLECNTEGTQQIKIYDSKGWLVKEVLNEILPNTPVSIDISSLPNGFYTLEASNFKQAVRKKFLKTSRQ